MGKRGVVGRRDVGFSENSSKRGRKGNLISSFFFELTLEILDYFVLLFKFRTQLLALHFEIESEEVLNYRLYLTQNKFHDA